MMKVASTLIWILLLVVPAPPVCSHSLDPESIDRFAEITIAPNHVVLIYELILGMNPTKRESRRLDPNDDGVITDAERDARVKALAEEYGSAQKIAVNGTPIEPQLAQGDVYGTLGHNKIQAIKVDLGFVAAIPAGVPRGATIPFTYEDGKIRGGVGWLQIKVRAQAGARFSGHVPYAEYDKFDYELINDKGFFPSSDSIDIEAFLPESAQTADASVILPERREYAGANKSGAGWVEIAFALFIGVFVVLLGLYVYTRVRR